ncbi:DUF6934 family protein [Dyadobacter jiangsuensis]
MDRPHYEFEFSYPYEIYSFISEGRNGHVRKRVRFDLVRSNIFNLGFGDWKEDDSDLDDLVVTDNGDMEMVLSTVIRITIHFLSTNPGITVHFTGSTAARTRLYRSILSTNYDVIIRDFIVLGLIDGKWLDYEKNVDYEAFLVQNRYNFKKL